MEIIEYFSDSRKEHWLGQIAGAKWVPAVYLSQLLSNIESFERNLGTGGRVFMLTDGDRLVSFAALTRQDSIKDESLYPWIGYVFTFPEYRGNRYSQKLIAYMEEQAKQEGHSHVYIATKHVGLYEKFGYEYVDSQLDEWRTETRIYTKEL